MSTAAMRARPLVVALFVLGVNGCSVGYGHEPYYPYRYPWYYNDYGAYSIVRRPVVVVDGWTNRAFGYRPYRGFVVRRHNSSPITYTGIRNDETIEVNLTGMGDSTRVEVRARAGDNKWDKERARGFMGDILRDYK
jgi:hypothetical protein